MTRIQKPHIWIFIFFLSVSDDFVCTKIYDKRDAFNFDILRLPLWKEKFLALHLKEFIFLSLYVLREHLVMLRTSAFIIKF